MTTCSKWPESQITQQDKPYAYCADWLGGLKIKKAKFSRALFVSISETESFCDLVLIKVQMVPRSAVAAC